MKEEIMISFKDYVILSSKIKKLEEDNSLMSQLLSQILEVADSRTHFTVFDEKLRDIRGLVRDYQNTGVR